MVLGLGTDLIEVSRIKESISDNPRFLSRFYGAGEQALFKQMLLSAEGSSVAEGDLVWLYRQAAPKVKARLAQTAAANFAGKEAVLKVLGTGLRGCQLREIEILRNELGQPYVQLSGDAEQLSAKLGIKSIQISLSHTKEHALAFAIGN